jgi:hypothetical protein
MKAEAELPLFSAAMLRANATSPLDTPAFAM